MKPEGYYWPLQLLVVVYPGKDSSREKEIRNGGETGKLVERIKRVHYRLSFESQFSRAELDVNLGRGNVTGYQTLSICLFRSMVHGKQIHEIVCLYWKFILNFPIE